MLINELTLAIYPLINLSDDYLVGKNKVGRPKGAKNKPKSEGVSKPKPKADKPHPKIKGKKKLLKMLVDETLTSSA